jgi:hypothetical protein
MNYIIEMTWGGMIYQVRSQDDQLRHSSILRTLPQQFKGYSSVVTDESDL